MTYAEVFEEFKRKFPNIMKTFVDYRPADDNNAITVWYNDSNDNELCIRVKYIMEIDEFVLLDVGKGYADYSIIK